jgi:uncharacterized protein YPO0396
MEQLNEEQKALEELVEDRMDTLTNEMFDSATEKIEEDANKQIEALEDTYTEERIAEMVAGALRNIDKEFVGIDGKITDLDSALMDFANNSVEYMGVMGDTLKTELLGNLNIAKETMEEIRKINADLGNSTYDNFKYISTLDSSASLLNSELAGLQNSVNSITLGDMSITIQGNTTEETIGDIKNVLDEYQQKIMHEIMANVK